MISEGYSEFFVSTATVAGALIGLLFVAISVRPTAAARTAHITVRLRAVAALSAFLDTLFLSLLALRPQPDLGQSAVALGAAGLVAMLVLLLLLATQGRDRPWHLARGAVLVLGQGVIYYLQLADGVRLIRQPSDVTQVDNLTILVVVLFALGVARAWEFTGADNPTLLGTVATVAGVRVPAREDEKAP